MFHRGADVIEGWSVASGMAHSFPSIPPLPHPSRLSSPCWESHSPGKPSPPTLVSFSFPHPHMLCTLSFLSWVAISHLMLHPCFLCRRPGTSSADSSVWTGLVALLFGSVPGRWSWRAVSGRGLISDSVVASLQRTTTPGVHARGSSPLS